MRVLRSRSTSSLASIADATSSRARVSASLRTCTFTTGVTTGVYYRCLLQVPVDYIFLFTTGVYYRCSIPTRVSARLLQVSRHD